MSLAYSYKRVKIDPENQVKSKLKWVVLDGEEYGGELSKRNVSVQGMIEKIGELTIIQAYFIHDELYRFWNDKNAYGTPKPDIEILLNTFCTKQSKIAA